MREPVAIIIPSYNYAAFLGEAIASALAQTHPEVVVTVVDDGSTDESVEVASEYEPEVSLVRQTNRGIERTFNEAVAASRCRYIVRLDADDRIEPTFVEETFAALQADRRAAYAYCDVQRFGERGGRMRAGEFSLAHLLSRNYVSATALLSRAAFLEVGGYLLPARGGYSPRHEDWDLWLRMARHGYRGVYVDSALVWWRRHEAGSRNIETSEQWPAVVAAFEERFADLYGRILFKVLQRPPFNRVVPWLRSRHARTALERVDRLVFGVPMRSRPS